MQVRLRHSPGGPCRDLPHFHGDWVINQEWASLTPAARIKTVLQSRDIIQDPHFWRLELPKYPYWGNDSKSCWGHSLSGK